MALQWHRRMCRCCSRGALGVFDVDTQGYSSIGSNLITGIGDLSKCGEGILVLDGINSYQGGTNIVGGVLEVNGDGNAARTKSSIGGFITGIDTQVLIIGA